MAIKDSITKTPAATLTIVVAYDVDLPDSEDMENVLDACRSAGRVESAEFTIHRAVTRKLV